MKSGHGGLQFSSSSQPTGWVKWLPKLIVFFAFTGFFTLAWYAYHTGTQSLKEEDLLVIEADKTPIKEKPLDPGGMKFPNQDKTIFETFSGKQQPAPAVERVLPSPEEPLSHSLDTSETKTFVNGQPKTEEPKKETLVQETKPARVATENKQQAQTTAKVTEEKSVAPAKTVPTEAPATVAKPVDIKPVASITETKPIEAKPLEKVQVDEKPVQEKPVQEKVAKEKTKPITTSSGSARVQLGAYQSESEAKSGFSMIQKKFADLAGREPIIVRADLGAKGTFFRLRVGGFANAEDAKSFCKMLSGKGQACILAQ